MQEEVAAESYSLKLSYIAKSSDGLRLAADANVLRAIPGIIEPIAASMTPVEVIEPLPLEYSDAAPTMDRFNEMQQWVLARRATSAPSVGTASNNSSD